MTMKQSTKRILCICCVIVLLAAAGIGGYFIGKAAEADRTRSEKELNTLLNRSDLDGLGEFEGKIYVTGHKSPDSDTVGSSIAYAALLRALGYDAVPVLLGPLNHESEYILKAAGLETPELLEDASGLNMVLVDHSEYTQSANGLENANILMIVDHHGTGAVTTGNPLIYDARPIGSAATITWLRYRNYGVEPDQSCAIMMMGAILSDTKNLQSGTTTFADREAVKVLSGIGGITDVDAFYQGQYKALLSYEGKTDEEIFFTDYKEYNIGGKKVSVGNVNAYDEETAKDLVARMRAVMPAAREKKGMDMSFAMVSILHDDLSVTWLVPSDEAADEVLKAAFGDRAFRDGEAWKMEPYASRKAVFIPGITTLLEAASKE